MFHIINQVIINRVNSFCNNIYKAVLQAFSTKLLQGPQLMQANSWGAEQPVIKTIL